jgi:hypothetical protein
VKSVELDDGIGLRPEPDLPGVLERVVGPVEHPVPVLEDDEVIAGGLELHRVPGALGHFDGLPSELTPAAAHDVIDPAVVLEGVAAGDVVVVRVPVSPDEAETLVDLPGERPRPYAQDDVLVGAFLEHGDGEAVIGLVRALLDENMVRGPAPLDADQPPPLRATAGPAELEAGGRGPDRIGLEIPLHGLSRAHQRRDGADDGENHDRALHRTSLGVESDDQLRRT